jgi:hypothetical protein
VCLFLVRANPDAEEQVASRLRTVRNSLPESREKEHNTIPVKDLLTYFR